MKRLLENRFWDWLEKQQDALGDESDRIIYLICLGILVLSGIGWVILT